MADNSERTSDEVRLAPPKFGRNVSRPRVTHALEVVEEVSGVLDEIDRLIAGSDRRPIAVA